MSRTFEQLSEKQNGKGVPTVVPEPQLPANLQDELAFFRRAAMEERSSSFLGSMLTYTKGRWMHKSDGQKIELPIGTRLVMLPSEARRGWTKWHKGKAVAHVVGKIAEGFVVPGRETLGDNDESKWPIGLNGTREDPWQYTIYAPFVTENGAKVLTYATTSYGGKKECASLFERYASDARKHPGAAPVVTLGSAIRESKFGPIPEPRLDIVGWIDRPTVMLSDAGTKAEASEPVSLKSDEMDDEIPF